MRVTERKINLKSAAKSIVGLSVFVSLAAYAEQVTFIGKVKTELPQVTITGSADPVSDVKRFTLSVSPGGGICGIDVNEGNATRHGSTPVCLLTWEDPNGLDAHLRGLRGVVTGAGDKTFKYTLSMFDKDKFDLLSEQTYSVTFSEPVPSDTPSLLSQWRMKEHSPELVHNIYNRNEENTAVKFDITPRNYDQKIEFGEHSCLIREGSTNCTIVLNKKFTELDTQGDQSLALRATDNYGHFDKESQSFQYVWDFRPPQIEGVHVNSNDSRLPMVVTEYGETLVLLHDQAAVVVKSPHANIEDDWWLPTDPTLNIIPNLTLNITNVVSINNTNVTFDVGTTSPNGYISRPIANPARMGDYLVYVYDFSEINDGLYTFKFSTQDKNGNGEIQTLDDIYVDRFPPDIQFVVNQRQHRSRAPANVYSLSDITIATWGGWEDGSQILSAKINDEPIEFAGGTDLVKRLNDKELPLGSLNTLEVLSQDNTGNQVSKKMDFHFGRYDFKSYSQPVMATVQPAEIFLETIRGASCIAATSEDLARLYTQTAKGLRRGCTIEWLTQPVGINIDQPLTISTRTVMVASGAILTPGMHDYAFNVIQHDAFGSSRVVHTASGAVEVLPLEAPSLTVGLAHIAQNYPETYKYKLPHGRPLTVPSMVGHAKSADIVVELRDANGLVLETKESNLSRTATRINFNRELPYAPLSDNMYSVRTYYKIDPSKYTQKPYHFFVTPPSMVRLTLAHPSVGVQGTDIPIIASIGLTTGSGFEYLPTLGQWDIHLAMRDAETNSYVNFTEPTTTDFAGKVALTLPSDRLLASNNDIIAIAKFKSPFPEIDITLRASSLVKLPVLTAGGLSVQLSSAQTSSPAPANFLVQLSYETRSDRLSADSVIWESSSDAVTWTQIDRSRNQSNTFIHLPDAQERFVRASINHKLSQDIVYTNVIRLHAYDEAVLTLRGDRRVLVGAMGYYHFDINQYAINNSTTDVEWTLDNGLSWQPMSPTDDAVITHSMDIQARLLISPPNVAPYYVYDTFTVQQMDPTPLSAIVMQSDQRAEVGDEIKLSARFTNTSNELSSSQRYHFVKPDGSVTESLLLSHVLQDNDFSNSTAKFLFRSWLDGHQMQTISTRELSVAQIIYEFPQTNVVVTTPERVVQSNININLMKPLDRFLPKRVIIQEEIILPPELELHSHMGRSLRLVANRAGLHRFTVRFYDNRGNQREHIAFVEALEPEDMTMSLNSRLEGRHIRPPIRLISRVSARPGSPRDRLSSVSWYLNDELITDNLMTTQRAIITEPGEYTLRVVAQSNFGQEAEETFNFTVAPNKPPYCDPFWESRDRLITFNANCNDDDGRVMRVDVTFDINDEQERTRTGYVNHNLTFVKDIYPTNRPLGVLVIDDSGAEISFTFPWPN